MQERIDEMLAAVTAASQQPDAHRLLPYVTKSLQALSGLSRAPTVDRSSLRKAAGALGRIVTDDYTFSESPLGQSLLDLINDIAIEFGQCDR